MRIIDMEKIRTPRVSVNQRAVVNITKKSNEVRFSKVLCDNLGWAKDDKIVFGISDDGKRFCVARSSDAKAIPMKSSPSGGGCVRGDLLYSQLADFFKVPENTKSFSVSLEETKQMNGPYVWHELILETVRHEE